MVWTQPKMSYWAFLVLAHKRDHSLTKPCFELNNCTPGEGTTLPILAQRPKKKRGKKTKQKLIKAFKEATIHVDFKDRIASPASTIYTEFCFLKAGCSNLIHKAISCLPQTLYSKNAAHVSYVSWMFATFGVCWTFWVLLVWFIWKTCFHKTFGRWARLQKRN